MAGGRSQQRSAPRGGAHHATPSSSSSSAPPLPPPLPPPQAPTLDDLVNAPVRIYPMDRSPSRGSAATAAATPSAALLQCLQSVATPAVVVGVLASDATSPTGVYAFINRLIGRVAFMDSNVHDSAFGAKASLKTSIQLFYDPAQSIVFLLGAAKPDVAFLAGLDVDKATTDEHDFGDELLSFQQEKRKMELLVHACSHLLFQFNERGRFTANLLKHVRSLAAEKQSLLALLVSNASSGGKNPKRSDKASSSLSGNVLAPGRCVPLTMFVVPAREDVINATLKQLPSASSIKSRSSTVAFCKSHEAMLCNLFRSLRGGVVGTLRTRDAVSPANLSKERRLFHVDPAHCVAVLSQTAASDASRIEKRFESLLSSLSMDFLMGVSDDEASGLDLDTILEPLEEDDVGFPNAIQHLHRGVELIQQNASTPSSSASSSKDANVVKMDLLTVAQWLKAFQSVLKTLHRAETKKKQDRAAAAATGMDTMASDRDSMRHQFDYMDIRS